jgi:hypothetical protein
MAELNQLKQLLTWEAFKAARAAAASKAVNDNKTKVLDPAFGTAANASGSEDGNPSLAPGTASGPNEVTAPTATEAIDTGTAPGPGETTGVTEPTATEAMEELSQEGAKWDGTSSEDERIIQAIDANKVGSQPWSEEGSGDLIVAPEANNTQESKATMADDGDLVMSDTASGKQSTHDRLNARSAKLILLSAQSLLPHRPTTLLRWRPQPS